MATRAAVDRGSLAQYERVFITDIFDENIHWVLYLDCDTIISGSLRELWNLNLEGNVIATLKDAFSKHYRKNLVLKPHDLMFNSSVMLIDLDA